MSAALGLLRLQKVDNNIGQAQSRLEEIRRILEDNAELTDARTQLESARDEHKLAEQDRRSEDVEAQALRLKIQGAESSLYGGTVRNPKELQDLQADVEALKRRLNAVEERELEAMVRLETTLGTIEAAEATLGRVSTRIESEQALLLQERSNLNQSLTDLRAERDAAVAATSAEHLRQYQRLLQSRRGLAVAQIADGACEACGTALTAALQQSARHASVLTYCPSCGRILYGD
ncbi:MAG: zinc ribbon domain-containing protein [Anaerolineales bacterium]|jgi:predicted  nucleic acid-binding Zn-ribbon protein